MLIARFDGACEGGNPGGHGAYGCLVKRDGVEVFREAKYLGKGKRMTNNVAEFEGVKAILKWYLDSGLNEVMKVIGDSQVVIFRMSGRYRKPVVGLCAGVAKECLELRNLLPTGMVQFEWQRRDSNHECDGMAGEAIKDNSNVAIGFRGGSPLETTDEVAEAIARDDLREEDQCGVTDPYFNQCRLKYGHKEIHDFPPVEAVEEDTGQGDLFA